MRRLSDGATRHPDLAPDAFGQAVAVFLARPGRPCRPRASPAWRRDELRPGVAAVARNVQPAAGAAAGQFPGPSARLPQTGEQDARIVRVEADVEAPVSSSLNSTRSRSCRRRWCGRRRAPRWGRRHGPARRRRRCPGLWDGRSWCRSGPPASRRASRSCRRRWTCRCRCRPRRCRECWPRRSRRRSRWDRTERRRCEPMVEVG